MLRALVRTPHPLLQKQHPLLRTPRPRLLGSEKYEDRLATVLEGFPDGQQVAQAVPEAVHQAVQAISLTPAQALGIPVALIGAVLLAAGAQFQQHGVAKVGRLSQTTSSSGFDIRQFIRLARRPSWLIGSILIVLAIAAQLFSLYLAPLTVVQPLGAVALVITAIINSRVTKTKLNRAAVRAIAFCVGGVALFVTIAAITTTTVPIDNTQLIIVLVILGGVLVIVGVPYIFFRSRLTRIFYVISAGVLFGFVATFAKVLITRIQTIIEGGFHLVPADSLTFACLLGLIVAGSLGTFWVQTAYATGSPELVVAGLTVIDPIVGVTIGIVVLNEAAGAPLWSVPLFVLAGILAVYGVIQLARRADDVPLR
jgi:drug/metabolite transporter (DMT)-like permease